MATSLFFMPTDQTSVGNPNELLINTHLVSVSSEIRTEPPHKSRGRKPGSKTGQQNQKKQRLRGMGVAQLERIRIEEEKKQVVVAGGGDTSAAANINATRIPAAVPDPVVVLQGFPSYGGPTTSSLGGCTRRLFCGGVGSSGQIMIDPVCCPWGFVETSSHELSSIPNLQMCNASNHRLDTCFKKKRVDGDQNVVPSNGGGFSRYTLIPPPMNGYDHLFQPDQRSQGFFYDQRITRSAASSTSTDPYFNEPTNHTASIEEFGSGNPKNGTEAVKEYEFFPGKYDSFQGKYGKTDSVATSVGDCSPNTSTIDLSLKL